MEVIVMPTIPPELSLLLIAFASAISHYLRGDNMARQWNILLAAVACVLAGAVTFWLLGGFDNPHSVRESILACAVFTGTLAGKELLDLLTYLKQMASPMGEKTATVPMPAIRRTTR
jgi:hypothetical protein